MRALRLLQSALVHVDTLPMQQVLADPTTVRSVGKSHAGLSPRSGVIAWNEDGTPLSLLAFTVADGRSTADGDYAMGGGEVGGDLDAVAA